MKQSWTQGGPVTQSEGTGRCAVFSCKARHIQGQVLVEDLVDAGDEGLKDAAGFCLVPP